HDDQAHLSVGKPALELSASEPVFLSHAPGHVGHGQLEDGLCQIDGDGCSIHVGLLSFEDLIHTPMKTSAPMWREKRGESIPSIDTDVVSAGFAGLLSASHLRRLDLVSSHEGLEQL